MADIKKSPEILASYMRHYEEYRANARGAAQRLVKALRQGPVDFAEVAKHLEKLKKSIKSAQAWQGMILVEYPDAVFSGAEPTPEEARIAALERSLELEGVPVTQDEE